MNSEEEEITHLNRENFPFFSTFQCEFGMSDSQGISRSTDVRAEERCFT